jgi:hypothetical protein
MYPTPDEDEDLKQDNGASDISDIEGELTCIFSDL